MDKIENETHEAQQTVKKIRSKTSQHLSGFQGNSPHDCCETPILDAAALAGKGVFGSGIAMIGSDCGLSSIFGWKNTENFDRLNEYTSLLTD